MSTVSAGFISRLSNALMNSGEVKFAGEAAPEATLPYMQVGDLEEPEQEEEEQQEAAAEEEEEEEEEEEGEVGEEEQEQSPNRRSTRSQSATPAGTPAKDDLSSPTKASKRKPISRVRQFWHAAEDFPKDVTQTLATGLDHARLHPKFLHTNATSHKWALGAFAELLDNAIDEVPRGATYVSVDVQKQPGNKRQMLVFEDDGFGMTPENLRSCMSFGYSKKLQGKSIGQYGNGFKTGTIRLGADALVFTRCESDGQVTESCGLLSYTFLRETGQVDVVVPIVDWVGEGVTDDLQPLLRNGTITDWDDKLQTIMQWSPFKERAAFFEQFERIREIGHGTTILVYNLWETEEGDLELDLTTDQKDIRSRVAKLDMTGQKQPGNSKVLQDDPYDRWKFSLKAYAGILYLRRPNNFKIYLRGHEVPHTPIHQELKHTQMAKYTPRRHAQDGQPCPPVEIVVGFSPYAPRTSVMGFCVYNKNRLIKPFWKVYSSASSTGRGVVGILEANFVEPAHDKQDFEKSYTLSRLEVRLKKLVTDYWKEKAGEVGYWSACVKGYTEEMKKRKKAAAAAKVEESDDDVYVEDDDDAAPLRKVKVEGRGDAANQRARPAKRRYQASDVTDGDDEECEDEGEDEVIRSPVALQQRCSQLSEEKTSLQQRVEELEKQVARLQQERKAALQTASNFQRSCEEAQLAQKQLDAKLRRLSTTTSMLQVELESARDAHVKKEETSRLSMENEELKRQLEIHRKKQADLMSMLAG